MKNKIYLAYFDTLGFEFIEDLTAIEKKKMWATLKGETHSFQAIHIIMRAKANPQRFPEIWTFQSEVDKDTLVQYSIDNPQELADLIREHGSKIYTTPRQKEIIK